MILMDMPNFGRSDMVVVDQGRLSHTADVIAGPRDALDIERAHFIVRP